jgi:hypothetical protein
MSLVLESGVYGGIVPVVVVLALVWVARRFLSLRAFEQTALAVACAAAFVSGWVLLPDDWTPLKPARPWHWLPYLGLLAAALSAVGYAKNPWVLRRLATNLLVAVAAAWLLAPNWPDLAPPRYVYILLLGGYLFALTTLLDALPDRLLRRPFPFLLFAAASATAVVIADPVSLTYGQIAGVAAASLFGCGAATWLGISAGALRGLIPVYTVLVGGIAFTGSIEPEPPLFLILLAPEAPLALWLCAYGPLARQSGIRAVVVQSAVVLLPLAILVVWILLGGESEYPEYDY